MSPATDSCLLSGLRAWKPVHGSGPKRKYQTENINGIYEFYCKHKNDNDEGA